MKGGLLQMSRLSKLTGKPKEYLIGGEAFTLKPRGLKDLDLIMDLSKEDKQGEALGKLLKVTLKEAVTDATDEEIDGFALTYFKELSEAVMDVNGLKDVNK
jgi:hypothetical protein